MIRTRAVIDQPLLINKAVISFGLTTDHIRGISLCQRCVRRKLVIKRKEVKHRAPGSAHGGTHVGDFELITPCRDVAILIGGSCDEVL